MVREALPIQKNILKYILEESRYTAFGKEYRLGFIEHDFYENFAKKVPIFTYETFSARIERAKNEEDIIWPGKITKFSASAGTTSRKKHIPVTNEALESAAKA